jgi:hypothetical protein
MLCPSQVTAFVQVTDSYVAAVVTSMGRGGGDEIRAECLAIENGGNSELA